MIPQKVAESCHAIDSRLLLFVLTRVEVLQTGNGQRPWADAFRGNPRRGRLSNLSGGTKVPLLPNCIPHNLGDLGWTWNQRKSGDRLGEHIPDTSPHKQEALCYLQTTEERSSC